MNVVDLIKGHEGLMTRPYHCSAGKVTIGWGRNLEDKGISLNEAEYLLANDISEVRAQLTANLSWFQVLHEVRQAALVDLCFNLGWPGLSGFRKFLGAMGRGDYAKAGAELVDSRWYIQVGRRGPRIVKMIQLAEWPEEA